jgi:hypothetical protein
LSIDFEFLHAAQAAKKKHYSGGVIGRDTPSFGSLTGVFHENLI